MVVDKFLPKKYTEKVTRGKVQHRAPSNIALVKYWGKKDFQLPANPSLSFTLTNSYTDTSVEFLPRTDFNASFQIDFYFEENPKEAFLTKIETFFNRMRLYMPFLRDYHFVVRSHNSFPHSSGIASSASAMAALAVCLMKIEKLFCPEMTDEFFYEKASFLARLGSGSACRSIIGSVVVWGEHPEIPNSSDLYGVPFGMTHEVFHRYQDTILLIDKGQKQISSTDGHDLMNNHPYPNQRFVQATENISKLNTILRVGALDDFVKLIESEALTLHSMMMTSNPYFVLMRPNTLATIEQIWNFRRQTQIPVGFTLDAGANIHLLYPYQYKSEVQLLIESNLKNFCDNQQIIEDEVPLESANFYPKF